MPPASPFVYFSFTLLSNRMFGHQADAVENGSVAHRCDISDGSVKDEKWSDLTVRR